MGQEEYFISDEAVVKRAKAAVQIELEKKRNMDIPAIVYDPETQKIYQKNSDGTRVEIGERLRKGRNSREKRMWRGWRISVLKPFCLRTGI